MRFNLFSLVLIVGILGNSYISYAGVDTDKHKKNFMDFCLKKQSQEYCDCSFNNTFIVIKEQSEQIAKNKVASREEAVRTDIENSISLDKSLTKEKLDKLCAIADKFADEQENYYLKKYNRKNPIYSDKEDAIILAKIQKKYDAIIAKMHSDFNTNKISRRNFTAIPNGYCLQKRLLREDKIKYEEFKKRDIKIDYVGLYKQGIRIPACRRLFKR